VKAFNTKKTTKEQLRKSICSFGKKDGVNRVTFNSTGKKVSGSYHSYKKNIYINMDATKQHMLRTFFHELAHHVAASQNKWKSYHFNLIDEIDAELMYSIENKIDKMAQTLWYKNVNLTQWGKYKYFYPKSQKNLFLSKL